MKKSIIGGLAALVLAFGGCSPSQQELLEDIENEQFIYEWWNKSHSFYLATTKETDDEFVWERSHGYLISADKKSCNIQQGYDWWALNLVFTNHKYVEGGSSVCLNGNEEYHPVGELCRVDIRRDLVFGKVYVTLPRTELESLRRSKLEIELKSGQSLLVKRGKYQFCSRFVYDKKINFNGIESRFAVIESDEPLREDETGSIIVDEKTSEVVGMLVGFDDNDPKIGYFTRLYKFDETFPLKINSTQP